MKELLDYRNENLWTEISNNYNVSFENSLSKEYGCFAQNNNVTFYIDKNNLCKSSFTHEMLHVYLRLKDCFISGGLNNTINQNSILSSIFSQALLEHMGNCLDHIKMFPVYINLGFEKEKFLLDFNENKCTQEELSILKNNYKIHSLINKKAVDFYIGKLFAILADPNTEFDYTQELNEFKQIDPILFEANNKMIQSWKEIKLENRKIWDDDYHTVLFEYYQDLEKWISINNIN